MKSAYLRQRFLKMYMHPQLVCTHLRRFISGSSVGSIPTNFVYPSKKSSCLHLLIGVPHAQHRIRRQGEVSDRIRGYVNPPWKVLRIMLVGRSLGDISGLSPSVKMYGEIPWDKSMLMDGGRRDSCISNVFDVSEECSSTGRRRTGCRSPSGVGGGRIETHRDDDEGKGKEVWMVKGGYGEYWGEEKFGKDDGEEMLYSGGGKLFSDRA
ncbi:hypothetical protein IW262DRAFT_185684 [Armillaria fumosa]|nr:hypothetical protein IW262DRAFT_185684 [Armillaria fumosa]